MNNLDMYSKMHDMKDDIRRKIYLNTTDDIVFDVHDKIATIVRNEMKNNAVGQWEVQYWLIQSKNL